MNRLVILGSGELGRQIAFYAKEDGHYDVVGFMDDCVEPGTRRHGLPILGPINRAIPLYRDGFYDVVMMGIGYKHFTAREKIYRELSSILRFGRIIHSSAYVDRSCSLGDGVVVYPGSVLDMSVCIGNNVVINAGCVIAHDSKIGDHSFLSPAVNIAGFVNIGSCVNLGIGTTVIDNISIGSGVRTGGGSVVVENIEVKGLYVGVPAKLKKVYDSI